MNEGRGQPRWGVAMAWMLVGLMVGACTGGGEPTDTPTSSAPTQSPDAEPTGPTGAGAPVAGPRARGYAMMADAPGGRGVFLLQGFDAPACCLIEELWELRPDASWHDITPSILPAAGTAFAFDPAAGVGVFVDVDGTTWSYDWAANSWTDRVTRRGPSELLGASMVHDVEAGRMIVFGGYGSNGPSAETWAYDVTANTWERMRPRKSPPPRNFAAMAYDSSSGRVILFAGAGGSEALDDTWGYDYEADSWTELSLQERPEARNYHQMSYDPIGERIIMFGGTGYPTEVPFGDTWAFDPQADAWTELDGPGPSERGWHAMAFDDALGRIVLFGGGASREAYTAETWFFDPGSDTWSLSNPAN